MIFGRRKTRAAEEVDEVEDEPDAELAERGGLFRRRRR